VLSCELLLHGSNFYDWRRAIGREVGESYDEREPK
jgi:hypothetical protein